MNALVLLLFATTLQSVPPPPGGPAWSDLRPLYEDLHAHPELSLQETATAAKLTERLRSLGFEVTTGIGGNGVVGVLKNGPGPVVMIRTELDALPVEEKTGLPYASRAMGKNPNGDPVYVMHACGHDVHMTTWVGTAMTLASDRKRWRGTLVMIGQPAEEVGAGARNMLDDGLYKRFPKPDFAIAVHDSDALPAGTVGIRGGPLMAGASSVDIVVHGRGGHGARPQNTIDPIVIAARIVLDLQTLVSRENDPLDPAVVTVGSIHGGTKNNIIPDQVVMQLSVRAFKPEVMDRLLKGIDRISQAAAQAAGAPPADIKTQSTTGITVNDAALADRIAAALRRDLGDQRVREGVPVTASEDFGRYAEGGVPILLMWLGAVNPDVFEKARREGTPLPGLHSPLFAPDAQPTILTGVVALTGAARELLGKP